MHVCFHERRNMRTYIHGDRFVSIAKVDDPKWLTQYARALQNQIDQDKKGRFLIGSIQVEYVDSAMKARTQYNSPTK